MDENYSKLFFKKEVYEIKEKDLIDFFSQDVEESSILEFKSGDVKLEKVYKEVSALCNSQGGLLIIGSPKPKKDKEGRETFEGELTRSGFKNKDWLYQKIYSNISPAPVGLKIHDVICEDEKIIQVLDIPKSINPPHQNLSNGIYYIRYETESKFAPHGLIEALFNRRQEPLVKFLPYSILTNKDRDNKYDYIYDLSLSNITDIPIIKISYMLDFYNVREVYDSESELVQRTFMHEPLVCYNDNKSGGLGNTTLVNGLNIVINYRVLHFHEPFFISCSVWGDNMKLHNQVVLINPISNKLKVIDERDRSDSIFSDVIEELKSTIERKKNNNEVDIDLFESLLNKLE